MATPPKDLIPMTKAARQDLLWETFYFEDDMRLAWGNEVIPLQTTRHNRWLRITAIILLLVFLMLGIGMGAVLFYPDAHRQALNYLETLMRPRTQ